MLRRLRIFFCYFFISVLTFGGMYIFCAGCAHTRPPALSGTATASLFCAGCADMCLVLFHIILSIWGGADVMRRLRASALSPWLSWCRPGSSGPSWPLLAPLGSPGLSCALLGSSGLSWARLGSSGLSWARLGSPGLSWVHSGFTGLVWILLRSIWSYSA